MRSEKPNCHRCRHFYITYEPKYPYGCRRFEMKSKRLPSVEVLESSGKECGAFERR